MQNRNSLKSPQCYTSHVMKPRPIRSKWLPITPITMQRRSPSLIHQNSHNVPYIKTVVNDAILQKEEVNGRNIRLPMLESRISLLSLSLSLSLVGEIWGTSIYRRGCFGDDDDG